MTTLETVARDGTPFAPPEAEATDEGRAAPNWDRLFLIAAMVAVVVPIIAVLVAWIPRTWYPANDNAFIELQTMDIPSHMPLVGVYSRFNFHHPGPAMFLIYLIPVRLFAGKGLLVGAGLINGVALVSIVYFLYRRGGRALVAGGTVVLLVFEHSFANWLIEPWNAWVAVLPFALVVILAWSVWCRDWWALPLLALAASFAVQSHVGYAMLAAWLLGSSFAYASLDVWRRRSRRQTNDADDANDARTVRCPPRALVLSIVALALCWVLPVWQQLTNSPGNFRLIASYFLHHPLPVIGWYQAAGLAFREFGVVGPWLGFEEPMEPFSNGTVPGDAVALVPVVVIFLGAAVLAWRRGAHDALRLQVLVGVAAVLGFFSLARISDAPFPYIIRWTWVLGMYAVLSTGWSLYRALVRRPVAAHDSARSEPTTASGIGAPGWVPGLVAIVLVGATVLNTQATLAAPLPQQEHSAAIAALLGPTSAAVRQHGNLMMVPEGESWGEVESGLVPELERMGTPIMVRPDSEYLYGPQRGVNGRPIDGRLVIAIREGVVKRRKAGAVPIAEFDSLNPTDRIELDTLQQRYEDQVHAAQRGETVAAPITATDVARFGELYGRGQLVAVYIDDGPGPAAPANGGPYSQPADQQSPSPSPT
jgi:hypothetical protein